MTYTKAESLSYGYLFGYLARAYKRNLQGGGERAITTTAMASFLPHGEDGGEPMIVVSYNGTRVVELTSSALEFMNVSVEHSKPAVNLYNRFLAEHAPGHRMVHDPRNIALMYGENPGKLLTPDFTDGLYFIDGGKFTMINREQFYTNYTKEAN